MLSYHLEGAISDLGELIRITKLDIEDIQLANHTPQFDRIPLKEELLKSFEAKKAMIDHEITSMARSNPSSELSTLLNDEQHAHLERLKALLEELKDVNKNYAKMVLTISNLYNSFLEKIFPTEMDGYKKTVIKDSNILKVKA